jgi:hypothetical protein
MVGEMLAKDILSLMRGPSSNDTLFGAWAVWAGEMVALRILQSLLRVKFALILSVFIGMRGVAAYAATNN